MKGLKSVSRLKRFNKLALCVAVLLISSGLPLAAQTAFVRVNQVGYVGGGSKRAYLMSFGAEARAMFSVKNFCGTTSCRERLWRGPIRLRPRAPFPA
jgi:hypothetical protein